MQTDPTACSPEHCRESSCRSARGGRAQFAAGDQQQIRPFVGPVVDVLVALEQLVDEFRALIRGFIRKKLLDLFGGGQDAGGIQEGPAKKCRIRYLAGRLDVQAFHFANARSSM